MADDHDTTTHRPGTPVEVWNRSLGRWAGHFEVTRRTPSGVQVRRRSDNAVLPETFSLDEVRPASESPFQR